MFNFRKLAIFGFLIAAVLERTSAGNACGHGYPPDTYFVLLREGKPKFMSEDEIDLLREVPLDFLDRCVDHFNKESTFRHKPKRSNKELACVALYETCKDYIASVCRVVTGYKHEAENFLYELMEAKKGFVKFIIFNEKITEELRSPAPSDELLKEMNEVVDQLLRRNKDMSLDEARFLFKLCKYSNAFYGKILNQPPGRSKRIFSSYSSFKHSSGENSNS